MATHYKKTALTILKYLALFVIAFYIYTVVQVYNNPYNRSINMSIGEAMVGGVAVSIGYVFNFIAMN